MKTSHRLRILAHSLAIALIFTAANVAKAQSQPSAKLPNKESTSGSMGLPSKTKNELTFKSTFDQYKPYTDEKTAAWRSANEEVGRIGGWRAYLKEANEPVPVAAPVAPPATTQPRSTDPHVGHGSKK